MNKRQKEKRERNKKDREWRKKIMELFKDKCAVPECRNNKRFNAHHALPKEIKETRHDVLNGVFLCAGHHKFFVNSAHKNPLWFFMMMEENYPNQLNYLRDKWKSLQTHA